MGETVHLRMCYFMRNIYWLHSVGIYVSMKDKRSWDSTESESSSSWIQEAMALSAS